MKKLLSISLILLLSAQCLFKLGVISYYEVNKDYIASKLCINKEKPITLCYGQCFLDRNLAIAGDDMKKEAPASNKTKIEIPDFIVAGTTLTFQRLCTEIVNNTTYLDLYSFTSSASLLRPPII